MKQSDEELVKLTLDGHREAFDKLVLRYQSQVAGYINRFLHDTNEVNDITQEIFLRSYNAIGQFRGDSRFSTWLFRIMSNYLNNYFAARRRQAPLSNIDIGCLEYWLAQSCLKENNNPEALLLCDEMRTKIKEVVDKMGNDIKITFVLREMEGFSYEDIADVLNVPLGTVRSRLFRAREMMAHEINYLSKK